jgi:hypothetical protein
MRRGDGGGLQIRRRPLRFALWLVGALVVALGLAQIFLPKLAASRISSRIGKCGDVRSVHVSAWPAVELLWGDADAVTVHARELSVSPSQTGKLLHEARGLDHLDVTADSALEGPLALHDVSLRKRGRKLHAQATLGEADIKAALPAGFSVQLLGSSGGQVEVRASGGLFGVGASVDAVAQASDGKLVVRPRGFLLEAFQLTLFSDPRVYIEDLAASKVAVQGEADAGASPGPSEYLLSVDASLR